MDKNLTEQSSNAKEKGRNNYWRAHVLAYQQSKLSMRDFCKQQQLPFHPFRYQLYKLRDMDRDQQELSSLPKLIPVDVADSKITQTSKDNQFHFSYQDGQLSLQCSGLILKQVSGLMSLIGDWYAQSNNGT